MVRFCISCFLTTFQYHVSRRRHQRRSNSASRSGTLPHPLAMGQQSPMIGQGQRPATGQQSAQQAAFLQQQRQRLMQQQGGGTSDAGSATSGTSEQSTAGGGYSLRSRGPANSLPRDPTTGTDDTSATHMRSQAGASDQNPSQQQALMAHLQRIQQQRQMMMRQQQMQQVPNDAERGGGGGGHEPQVSTQDQRVTRSMAAAGGTGTRTHRLRL